jgi:hypothetical protein
MRIDKNKYKAKEMRINNAGRREGTTQRKSWA